MTTEEALRVLRAASPHREMQTDDARSLIRPVSTVASREKSSVVDSIGEALMTHEMESLIWQPIEAARLILVLVERGGPSPRLLELALNYLSMYFQELDEVVEGCRSRIRAGESPPHISVALIGALRSVDGVLSDGSDS